MSFVHFFRDAVVFICFINLIFNRKCEINQALKFLKNACEEVHSVFVTGLEFY